MTNISKNNFCRILSKIFLPLFAAVAFLYGYAELSKIWSDYGGTSRKLFIFEYPFILFSFFIFYFPIKEKKLAVVSFISAFMPVLGCYILYDVLYLFFDRGPIISDIQNFHSLMDFSPLLGWGMIFFVIIIIGPVCFTCYQFWKETSSGKAVFIFIIKASLCFILYSFLISRTFYDFQKDHMHFVIWSHTRHIHQNGRVANILYYQNKKLDSLKKIKTMRNTTSSRRLVDLLYPITNVPQQNIHIVVLESFIDPRYIVGGHYNPSPLSPDLAPYLHKGQQFSLVKAPVYGGGTAQSEFEILTGIPAYAEAGSIEFNVLEGAQTISLVYFLKKYGYNSFAMIATDSDYFNAKLAYKSIGFEHVDFLKTRLKYSSSSERYMFDGDLFSENLKQVKSYLHYETKPMINYVVGMYGHKHYTRYPKLRPDKISSKHSNDAVHRIANQFFYRTQALAHYIKSLQELDPTGIILIISDHLPPLLHSNVTYQYKKKINIALLIDQTSSLEISNKRYFEITWLIWDLITNSNGDGAALGERSFSNDELHLLYFQSLAYGMGESILEQATN